MGNEFTSRPASHVPAIGMSIAEIVRALRAIADSLEGQSDAIDTEAGAGFAEAHDLIADLSAVMARHLEGLTEYLEDLGPAPEETNPPVAAPAATRGEARVAASRYLFTDREALAVLSSGYAALRRAAVAGRDRGTALVARQGFREVSPLLERLADMIPSLVASEFAFATRTETERRDLAAG